MPVISPRRSSTSGSSSLYGSTTSARATGGDSGSSSSATNRYSSYYDRAGSLSKVGSPSSSSYTPSSYSSYLSSYSNSTYIPRTSAYRSSSSTSSYLSGGSSALDSYRTSSYLGSNDSTSYSRYGLRKTQKTNTESLTKDKHDQTSGVNRRNETKKPPTGASSSDKRLSSSCSSSSLARLVATSGLDIYEKYSPAHYKPSTELSRSRSALSETAIANTDEDSIEQNNNKERERRRNEAIAVATVTIERPRSRYSRLYSKDGDGSDDTVYNSTIALGSRKKNVTKLASNSSSSDIPTATFTLRSNSSHRASKTKPTQDENGEAASKSNTKSSSNRTLVTTKSTKSELNDGFKNGISSAKPPEICNGVVDDLVNVTSSKLRLSSSTSALNNSENNLGIERSASDSGNTGGVGIGGDESAIAIANLDVPTTKSKQKCEPVLLVQQKQQQQQLKQTSTSKTVAQTAKKQSSSVYSELKPALTVRQIGGNFSGRTIGIGRGIPIATRIESAQRIPPPATTTSTTTTAVATRVTANAVRKANQQFFLIPEYQDKNFLKDECAVAHAQVSTPPTVTPIFGKRSHVTKNVTRKSAVTRDSAESKDAVGIKNSSNNNNNNNSVAGSLQQQTQQEITRLNISKTSVTNVMRRSAGVGSGCGYGHTLDSTTTTTTTKTATKIGSATISGATATTSSTQAHKNGIQFNGIESSGHPKAASHTNPTTKVSLSSLSTLPNNSSGYNSIVGKGNNVANSKTSIKPLVHRSIATVTTAPNSRVTGGENLAFTNSVNNNINNGQQLKQTNSNNNLLATPSSNNNNGHIANNNSMAAPTPGVAALDHDDIKYIDSDENTGITPPASSNVGGSSSISGNMGKFVECVELPMPTLINKPTTFTNGSRMRPKSTIVCLNNHHVFEKINNYKFANGSATTSGGAPEAVYSSTGSRRQPNTNIDSNSIKASIEKFNTYSEQKRLPLANAVTLRAHSSATGSTSNLQYHRHSGSDFDNCNLRQLSNSNGNSGGGSLTRNPYRATSALTSNGESRISQNVPLKAKVRLSDATVTASTATTTYKPTNKLQDERRLQQNVAANASGGATTETKTAAGEESIRSATTKSVLPPPSPTTSRYWDRESNRTSSLSTYSSSTHNHLDADKLSSDEKSEGLCGLRNIGNTCFMNSIIQCLSHTNELTKFLRNYSGIRSSTLTKDQQILQEFAKLIREMWTSNVHSVTPMDLKRAFSTKHRMYSDYNQQDAQEFLRFFLDSLHSALNSGVKGDPLKIDENLSDNKKADLTWEWYARYENSLIRDLFVGQLKSTLRCTTCGNTSVTFDPFWDLSVSLPSSSRCKLDACLELFIREEVLDGDEMPTCAKCKTRRKCTKSFSIQRFPKYLVIHLKRFSETRWSKMSNIVEFPTGERELNMGPYGANANTNMYYSLYAISNHMGSTAGGHYVALCKHPVSRKWHEFNDNIVSDPMSDSHLVSSSAYILFYERA